MLSCLLQKNSAETAAAMSIADYSYLHLENVQFWENQATQNGVMLNIRDESFAEIINSTFRRNLGNTSDERDYSQWMKCLGNTVHSKECMSKMSFYSEADMGLISVNLQSKCSITNSQLLKNNGTSLLFVSEGSYLSVHASNISCNLQINLF